VSRVTALRARFFFACRSPGGQAEPATDSPCRAQIADKDQANISKILVDEKIARSSIFVTTKVPPPSHTGITPVPECTAAFAVTKMQYDLAQLGMK
jgi:hypothetical protein